MNKFFLDFVDNFYMKKFIILLIALLTALFFVVPGFSLELYRKNTIASFYGADFHGKKTSNGEIFDMNKFTCANKELPFDTILKVTNLSNNKSVQVRVNDRGPFVVGRDIDLSTAAARELDMMKSGTANVRIEIVKRGENTKLSQETAESAKKIMERKASASKTAAKEKVETEKSAAKKASRANAASKKSRSKSSADSKSTPSKKGLWDIQVASFSREENARKCADELYKKGFRNLVYQTTKNATRVVIKKVPSSELEKTKQMLVSAGYTDFLVRERK